jgi:hypothetical protein
MYGNYDWDDARMMADLDARDRALQAQDRRERTEGHVPMWDRITDETAGPVIEPFDFSPVQVPERRK